MIELKPCPFCGGKVYIIATEHCIDYIKVKAECCCCKMGFRHFQSLHGDIRLDPSFTEVWNNRMEVTNE